MSIKSYLKRKFGYNTQFIRNSYSQEGEDILLEELLSHKRMGFYVDVGAHHPMRFSNTFRFYLQGWHGINIDAMPKSMDLFNIHRSRDINLELGISNSKKKLTYYMFNEPALNTFSESEMKRKNGLNNYHVIDTITIQTKSLQYILDNYLPPGKLIDFLTVDVEGLDLEVLSSGNWVKYRPVIVLVESLNKSVLEVLKSSIYEFMISKNYELIGKMNRSLFFKDVKY